MLHSLGICPVFTEQWTASSGARGSCLNGAVTVTPFSTYITYAFFPHQISFNIEKLSVEKMPPDSFFFGFDCYEQLLFSSAGLSVLLFIPISMYSVEKLFILGYVTLGEVFQQICAFHKGICIYSLVPSVCFFNMINTSLIWGFILSPECFLSIWCISCVRSLFYSRFSSFCSYFINSWFATWTQITTHGGTANSITRAEQRDFLWPWFHMKLCHLPTVLPSLEICQTNNKSMWWQLNVGPSSKDPIQCNQC